ncbi:FHA domain-containing protein [Agromyces protaetiae]|uniref:FHA domain-containing protein n=1 Tax=Agromyces protaetiae TaxID=2509455 RepID=A0A4V0YH78_9MICO|nr:FHA domain-containing protein [Agromyces protaetiae]QAY73761.1 FHA domain-containing protein [Agromyces protaetiae]
MSEYIVDRSGRWLAAIKGGAAFIAPLASAELVRAAWGALSERDPVTAVLGRLTRDGIVDLPPFALVVGGAESARVVLRGGFSVRAEGETVTGAGVSTWVERQVPFAAGVEIAAPFAAPGDDQGLPVVDGVVPALVVRLGERVAAAAPEGAASPPVAVPESIEADVEPVGALVPEAPVVPEAGDAPEIADIATADAPWSPDVSDVPSAEVRSEAPSAWAPPAEPVETPPAGTSEPAHADLAAVVDVPVHAIEEQTLVEGEPVEVAPVVDEPAAEESFDDATVVVSRATVESARAKAAVEPEPIEAATPADEGDHDGMTIAVSSIQRLRAENAGRAANTNAEDPVAVAAPSPSVRLLLPGGRTEELSGEAVIGRSPNVSRASGGRLPKLITIGADDPDISRSHLRIGLEGGTVVVTDLHSRNGTTTVQPGRAPVRLRAGEPTPVLVGTLLDLGGGWTVIVEHA